MSLEEQNIADDTHDKLERHSTAHKRSWRLPRTITHHPVTRFILHFLIVVPPVLAALLWVISWSCSPDHFDIGILGNGGLGHAKITELSEGLDEKLNEGLDFVLERRAAGDMTGTGRIRFGGMGYCLNDECVSSVWYTIPPGHLPSWLEWSSGWIMPVWMGFLVSPAPLISSWWLGRYANRPFHYFKTYRLNKSLASTGEKHSVPPFVPYPWFRKITPDFLSFILWIVLLRLVMFAGFVIVVGGDFREGVSIFYAGDGIYTFWRLLVWKRDYFEKMRRREERLKEQEALDGSSREKREVQRV